MCVGRCIDGFEVIKEEAMLDHPEWFPNEEEYLSPWEVFESMDFSFLSNIYQCMGYSDVVPLTLIREAIETRNLLTLEAVLLDAQAVSREYDQVRREMEEYARLERERNERVHAEMERAERERVEQENQHHEEDTLTMEIDGYDADTEDDAQGDDQPDGPVFQLPQSRKTPKWEPDGYTADDEEEDQIICGPPSRDIPLAHPYFLLNLQPCNAPESTIIFYMEQPSVTTRCRWLFYEDPKDPNNTPTTPFEERRLILMYCRPMVYQGQRIFTPVFWVPHDRFMLWNGFFIQCN